MPPIEFQGMSKFHLGLLVILPLQTNLTSQDTERNQIGGSYDRTIDMFESLLICVLCQGHPGTKSMKIGYVSSSNITAASISARLTS